MSILKKFKSLYTKSFYGSKESLKDIRKNIKNDNKNYSLSDATRQCSIINAIIEKRVSIIRNLNLQVKNIKENAKDNIITDSKYTDFLQIFYKPNGIIYPISYSHIIEHLISSYYYDGVAYIIAEYDNNIFCCTHIPKFVSINNTNINNNILEFNVTLLNTRQIFFTYDYDVNDFCYKDGNSLYILYHFGNFDKEVKTFISPYEKIKNDIFIYNAITETSLAYQRNGCKPSGIITGNYKDFKNQNNYIPSTKDEENKIHNLFMETIERMSGVQNAGSNIISGFGFDVQYTQIQQNIVPEEVINYQNFLTEIILSYSGFSPDFFNRQSKYNNASIYTQQGYMTILRDFNTIFLQHIQHYFKKYMIRNKLLDFQKNITIAYNEASIDVIKDSEIDRIMTTEAHIATFNEIRKRLKDTGDERYSSYEPLPPEIGDVLISTTIAKNKKNTTISST